MDYIGSCWLPGGDASIRGRHCRAAASAPSAAAAPSSSCRSGWAGTAWHRPAPTPPLAAAAAPAISSASLADAYHSKQGAPVWSQALGGVLKGRLGPRQRARSLREACHNRREAAAGVLVVGPGPSQHVSAGSPGPRGETGGTGSACRVCILSRSRLAPGASCWQLCEIAASPVPHRTASASFSPRARP